MRIKLNQTIRVLVEAGTEVEAVDSNAALLISTGAAVPVKAKTVEKAVKAPAEKKNKK